MGNPLTWTFQVKNEEKNYYPELRFFAEGSEYPISNTQVTAVLTKTVELKITSPGQPQLELMISREATKNLWHIKKYLDSYIGHLHGSFDEEEFDEIAKQFIKEKNRMSIDEIKICSAYLKTLLPDIELDDIAMILNVDINDVLDAFNQEIIS